VFLVLQAGGTKDSLLQKNVCRDKRHISPHYYFSLRHQLSTVGYGDLTVDQNPSYRAFIGAMYMLISSVVAVISFSAIASQTFSPLESFFENMFDRFNPKEESDLFLHERLRRIRFIKLAGLAVEVLAFIFLGMFVSQLVIYLDDDPVPGTDWNWMTSFYWAVQVRTWKQKICQLHCGFWFLQSECWIPATHRCSPALSIQLIENTTISRPPRLDTETCLNPRIWPTLKSSTCWLLLPW